MEIWIADNWWALAAGNFSSSNASPVTHGANALKIENEITSENIDRSNLETDVNEVNNQYHEELLKNQQAESIVEDTLQDQEASFTQEATDSQIQEEDTNNDLKEFGVDSEAPDLFNSGKDFSSSEESILSDPIEEEDDLEIPAFLRRQKN